MRSGYSTEISRKLLPLLKLVHQLQESNTLFSSRTLFFIFITSLASLATYASWVGLRRIISWFYERREYQKLRYYYVLNKERSPSEVNVSAVKHNKSLLKLISLVGFNRNDIGESVNFKTVFLKQKERVKKILIKRIDQDIFDRNNLLFKTFKKKVASSNGIFNFRFINKLLIIWNILIPSVFNKNSYWLSAQIVFLIVRTYLSVLITKLDGQIVKDITGRNLKSFVQDIAYWFLVAFPASYVNSAIKFFEKRLALNFRTNLVRYVHDLYMNDQMVFYKVNGIPLPEDQKQLENIDQFITSDITKFCDLVTSLISNLGKPIIDVVIFSLYLRDNIGTAGIIGLFANFAITSLYLKRHTPDFGEMTKSLQSLEGEYFNYHTNLITNSEEISFYGGLPVERSKVGAIFHKLTSHIGNLNKSKLQYNVLENYVLKIVWNASGYVFAALPVLKGTKAGPSVRQFITNKRLIFSLADSTSRLIYSAKDISSLSGYTDRVFGLLSMLHRCNAPDFAYHDQYVNDIKGTIQNDYNGIRVEKMAVIVPSKIGSYGTKLVLKLTFSIKPGENLLVLGFNGSGKTSIERVLAGLWPLYKGLVSRPAEEDIMYLPQVPYFIANGSFRDQLIYPMTEMEFYEQGYVDGDLVEVLRLVKLEYLLDREKNYFNSVHDWNGVLSGGEKQRMNFARVLFRHPKFVVLDELTNAISTDIEDYLYDLLKTSRITYLSLSHRPLLMKYHNYLIQLEKDGEWRSETLGTSVAMKSIEKEIEGIEENLAVEDKLLERLKEIDAVLGGTEDDL